MADSQDLKSKVVACLEFALGAHGSGIRVDVEDGIVTLSGPIDSHARMHVAASNVRRLDGVRDVNLLLQIALKETSSCRDRDLEIRARKILASKVIVPPDTIRVQVHDGRVTLTGEVEWSCQRWAARDAIEAMPGVVDVVDRIEISPNIRGEEVKANVRAALRQYAPADSLAVEVSIDGACVKLSGTVDSYGELRAACFAAWTSPGVKSVVTDDLRVLT